MGWFLIAWILFIATIALIAGLIFYKKDKALNKKIEDLKAQNINPAKGWLTRT